MARAAKKYVKQLQNAGIDVRCPEDHPYHVINEDDWMYLICPECLTRDPLTVEEMEILRVQDKRPVGNPLFGIFGSHHATLYTHLEAEAARRDLSPEKVMFTVLEAYLELVSKNDRPQDRAKSRRRARLVASYKDGQRLEDIASDFDIGQAAVVDLLKKEGVYKPRPYKERSLFKKVPNGA